MDLNITLISIIAIMLLYIPGFFFKRMFYSGQFTGHFHTGTFIERFISSIFWGIMVQYVALVMLGRVTDMDYNKVRIPLTAFYKELSSNSFPACTAEQFNYSIAYILVTIVIACVLGVIAHNVVRLLRLDIIFPVLNFGNPWGYYFKGDVNSMSKLTGRGRVISTEVTAIVDNGQGGTDTYNGTLAHFTTAKDTGTLETFALSAASRLDQHGNYQVIQSEGLIIPYSKVINIHVDYALSTRTTVETVSRGINIFALLMFAIIVFYMPYRYVHFGWLRILIMVALSLLDLLSITGILYYPVSLVLRRRHGIPVLDLGKVVWILVVMAIATTIALYKLHLKYNY